MKCEKSVEARSSHAIPGRNGGTLAPFQRGISGNPAPWPGPLSRPKHGAVDLRDRHGRRGAEPRGSPAPEEAPQGLVPGSPRNAPALQAGLQEHRDEDPAVAARAIQDDAPNLGDRAQVRRPVEPALQPWTKEFGQGRE